MKLGANRMEHFSYINLYALCGIWGTEMYILVAKKLNACPRVAKVTNVCLYEKMANKCSYAFNQ